MNIRAVLVVLLTLIGFWSQAQKTEGTNKSFLETRFGVVSYNYFDALAPAAELCLATPVGKYFAAGVFVGGHASIATSEGRDSYGKLMTYNPKGLQAGLKLRVNTNPQRTHFFGEISGSVGKAFDTGISSVDKDNGAEYLVGTNIGMNFKLEDGDFLGLSLGLGIGQLDMDYGDNYSIARFQFGLTYHK